MLFEYVTPGFCLIIYPVINLHVSVPCYYLEHNTLTLLNHTVLPHATSCTRTALFNSLKPNFNFHICVFFWLVLWMILPSFGILCSFLIQ